MPDESEAAGHSFWSGTITFGLVTVPVNLFPANRSGGVHARMLAEDGTPLRRRFICPEEDRELAPDELVRGYEISEGEFVVVTDEELESLAPRKSRDIDLRAFVDEDQIEPRYFERSYFLTPAGETNKAYRLLAAVMEKRKQAAVATFVMRDREYLIAILAESGILRAETLRFQDEVRDPEEVGVAKAARADAGRTRHMVQQMQKRTGRKLSPALLRDDYAERVEQLIRQKGRQRHKTVKIESDEPEDGGAVDLVAILKQSLQSPGTARHGRATPRRGRSRAHANPARRRSGQTARRA